MDIINSVTHVNISSTREYDIVDGFVTSLPGNMVLHLPYYSISSTIYLVGNVNFYPDIISKDLSHHLLIKMENKIIFI